MVTSKSINRIENKPLESINYLISKIKPFSKRKQASKNSSFIFNGIILLEEGIISTKRDDGVALLTFTAPIIIGLHSLDVDDDIIVDFHCKASYYHINKKIFFMLAEENNLWKHICVLTFYYLHLNYEREKNISRKTKYETVKYYIESIWKMEASERSSISLFKFIMSHANISRSSLHKIISELNRGGYIKTERGRLINVVRLPEAF